MPKLCKRTAFMHADASEPHYSVFHGAVGAIESDRCTCSDPTATGGITTVKIKSQRRIKD